MQKLFLILISVGCLFGAPLSSLAGSDVAIIGTVLDDFHEAAAKADGQRYFAHLADNAIFMGTDATERWTVEQFKAYAMPHFNKGEGWTYKSVQRHVEIAPGGKLAWFDELLENKKYGTCRGSGVLAKVGNAWRITQYNLALMIPNERAKEVVNLIGAK